MCWSYECHSMSFNNDELPSFQVAIALSSTQNKKSIVGLRKSFRYESRYGSCCKSWWIQLVPNCKFQLRNYFPTFWLILIPPHILLERVRIQLTVFTRLINSMVLTLMTNKPLKKLNSQMKMNMAILINKHLMKTLLIQALQIYQRKSLRSCQSHQQLPQQRLQQQLQCQWERHHQKWHQPKHLLTNPNLAPRLSLKIMRMKIRREKWLRKTQKNKLELSHFGSGF